MAKSSMKSRRLAVGWGKDIYKMVRREVESRLGKQQET
jgi:hypothetical protein